MGTRSLGKKIACHAASSYTYTTTSPSPRNGARPSRKRHLKITAALGFTLESRIDPLGNTAHAWSVGNLRVPGRLQANSRSGIRLVVGLGAAWALARRWPSWSSAVLLRCYWLWDVICTHGWLNGCLGGWRAVVIWLFFACSGWAWLGWVEARRFARAPREGRGRCICVRLWRWKTAA
jgi:hypothetical protein